MAHGGSLHRDHADAVKRFLERLINIFVERLIGGCQPRTSTLIGRCSRRGGVPGPAGSAIVLLASSAPLTDFVEQDRAASGVLEEAHFVEGRAVKRALTMAEESDSSRCSGARCQSRPQTASRRARRCMQGAGTSSFAGPLSAEDEHGGTRYWHALR